MIPAGVMRARAKEIGDGRRVYLALDPLARGSPFLIGAPVAPPAGALATRWATRLEGALAEEFDAFVTASPAGHDAQTVAWARVACAGAPVAPRFIVVREAGDGPIVGTSLVSRIAVGGLALPFASIERGPVCARLDDLPRVLRATAIEALRHGVGRLRVMPYWSGARAAEAEAHLRRAGFRDVQSFSGPHARTLRLDLAGPDVWSGSARQQVRWRARQAERAGVSARRGGAADWTDLRALHAGAMAAQGRRDRPGGWWAAIERHVSRDERGALFVGEWSSRLLSAAVILRHGARATYSFGASVPDRLPFSKTVLPLVLAIRWARDAGCTTFDLGGVPLADDDDPKRNAIATFKFDFDRHPVPLVRQHAAATWRVARSHPQGLS